MTPFRSILVPTDFSACAEEATRLASGLSRLFEAPLTLAYVFERSTYPLPDEYVLFTAEQLDYMFGELNQRLAQARNMAADAGAVRASTRLLQGWAPRAISDCARDDDFDLIVIGTHGRKGLLHVALGSVAERVVRMAPCPVLTVRSPR